MMKNRFLLILLAVFSFLGGANLCAQGSSSEDAPTLHVDVNRILVPVQVFDSHGASVHGLTKDDFEVLDDGKQHAISAFNVFDNSVNAAAKPAIPRAYLFFFDDMQVDPRDLSALQSAALRILDKLGPNDYVGVVSTSNSRSYKFTRAHDSIAESIKHLQLHPRTNFASSECPEISYDQALQIDRDHSTDSLAMQTALSSAKLCRTTPNDQETMAIAIRNQVRAILANYRQSETYTVNVLAATVHAIGKVASEKHIIFISPGFDSGEQEIFDAESRLVDTALEAGVTLSTLDPRGLNFNNTSSIEENSSALLSHHSANAATHINQNLSLEELANGTGGTCIINSNNLQSGFEKILRQAEVEYVLELSADHSKGDGKFHLLKVKLNRPGLTVLTRRGYFLPKPEKLKK